MWICNENVVRIVKIHIINDNFKYKMMKFTIAYADEMQIESPIILC